MFAGMLSHIDAPTIEVRVYQDGELLLRQECDRDEAVAIVDRASDSDHVYLLVHSTTSNRGPGDVTFTAAKPKTEVLEGGQVNEPFRGKATTEATFSAPGEYVLHVVANDYSGDGGGGEVCCWTFGFVKVTVTP